MSFSEFPSCNVVGKRGQKPRLCSSEVQGSNGGSTATFALCKELQPGGGKVAQVSFQNLLSNQSKKKDDRVDRILGMCRLDTVRHARRTMIQLKISTFLVARTSSTRAVLFSIFCPWTYLLRYMSASLNGEAGDVFGRQCVSGKFFT